jgi:site-specific recombinase XerD
MIGCRPLKEEEVDRVKQYFDRTIGNGDADEFNLQARNKALLFFGMYTGFRISETLSLTVGDVIENGKVRSNCYVQKCNMKGKKSGRNIEMNEGCRNIIRDYALHYGLFNKPPTMALWFSRKSDRITTRAASNIYHKIFDACGIEGKVATHTSRKTFATRIFASNGRNVFDLKTALGHRSVASTQSYIAADYERVGKVIEELKY